MIQETIRNRLKAKVHSEYEVKIINGYNDYIQPFSEQGRKMNEILYTVNNKTLEFVCFHKNWHDIINFTDMDNWNKQGP